MAVTASWTSTAIRRASRRPCRMPSAQMSSSTTGTTARARPSGPAKPARPSLQAPDVDRAAAVLLQLAERGQRIQDDVPQQCQRPGGAPDRGGEDGADGENRHGEGQQVAGFAPGGAVPVQRALVALDPPAGRHPGQRPRQSHDGFRRGPHTAPAGASRTGRRSAAGAARAWAAGRWRRGRRRGPPHTGPISRASTIRPSQPSPAYRASWVNSRNRVTAANWPAKEHGRAPGAQPPLGEAQQQQDHQRRGEVGQQVGGEEHRGEQRTTNGPLSGPGALTEATSSSCSGGPERKLPVAAPVTRKTASTVSVNGMARKWARTAAGHSPHQPLEGGRLPGRRRAGRCFRPHGLIPQRAARKSSPPGRPLGGRLPGMTRILDRRVSTVKPASRAAAESMSR